MPGFKSPHHPTSSRWLTANSLTFLFLRFLTCNIGMIITSTSWMSWRFNNNSNNNNNNNLDGWFYHMNVNSFTNVFGMPIRCHTLLRTGERVMRKIALVSPSWSLQSSGAHGPKTDKQQGNNILWPIMIAFLREWHLDWGLDEVWVLEDGNPREEHVQRPWGSKGRTSPNLNLIQYITVMHISSSICRCFFLTSI